MEPDCPILLANMRNASGKKLSSKLPAVSRPDCGSAGPLAFQAVAPPFGTAATSVSGLELSRDLVSAGFDFEGRLFPLRFSQPAPVGGILWPFLRPWHFVFDSEVYLTCCRNLCP